MKGVIWVRFSSIDQSAGYSPDAQLRAQREAAARKTIEVVKEFNVSESAKTSEARKQFRELIQFIDEYRADYLIAYTIDRITRNPEDLNTHPQPHSKERPERLRRGSEQDRQQEF